MQKKLSIAGILLFLFAGFQTFSQEWEVPADQISLKNPSAFNNANVKAGRDLYTINCKSCHGDPGKNNALPLVPPPPDITSEKMLRNSEGALFFKITSGRVAMPSFAGTLTEEQRWKIINFMKSFDPANAGLLVREEPVKAKLQASADETARTISVSAQQQDKTGEWIPLANADVFVKAKRTFGSLGIGTTRTNERGYAEYKFPSDYKGDKEGIIDLELTLNEDFSSTPVLMNRVKIAAPGEPENLFAKRVLWSTNDRTAWWVILSYIGVVGGVWLTIVYVVFQVVKIYKAGKD